MSQYFKFAFAVAVMAGLTNVSHGGARNASPPTDCVEACQTQYRLLAELDEYTSIDYITQAFGAPAREAKSSTLVEIKLFSGLYADLFVFTDTRKKHHLAYAIATKSLDPKYSAYAPMPLLWQGERTLADVTMETAIENCSGRIEIVDLKNSVGWTPPCYFGGPGRYKSHSFLLYMNGADCNKTLEDTPFSIETLKCHEVKRGLPAVASFVALAAKTDDQFRGQLQILSDFMLLHLETAPMKLAELCKVSICCAVMFVAVQPTYSQSRLERFIEPRIFGYYVVARNQTVGAKCDAANWSSNQQINGLPAPQLMISEKEVQYYNGSVRCVVEKARKAKLASFVNVGENESVATITSLKCFDEGTVGRAEVTWKLMAVGLQTVLLEQRARFTPELWIKCTGSSP